MEVPGSSSNNVASAVAREKCLDIVRFIFGTYSFRIVSLHRSYRCNGGAMRTEDRAPSSQRSRRTRKRGEMGHSLAVGRSSRPLDARGQPSPSTGSLEYETTGGRCAPGPYRVNSIRDAARKRHAPCERRFGFPALASCGNSNSIPEARSSHSLLFTRIGHTAAVRQGNTPSAGEWSR
jgi:hypothetical protein